MITPERFDAALFDLDGVLTATASVHAACWKTMFDAFLRAWAEGSDERFRPFEIDPDYRLYVDGKPRYDGVRSFLESRGIRLPEGDVTDPPGERTVCGLGNRKNELVHEALRAGGIAVYGSSVELVKRLRDLGLKTAVVTSSRNCALVLEAAGITHLFDATVDGARAAAEGLPGKPSPDTFLRGAELLGAEPARAVVFEDSIAGVAAGRAGRFGLVVGVDREGHPEALRQGGADIVVSDLAELLA
jgi:beta-phosphoglucomutase family hydrolase